MTKFTKAEVARATEICESVQKRVCTLADRWASRIAPTEFVSFERQLKKLIPEDATLVEFFKKPFGFSFSIESGRVFRIYATADTYGLKIVPEAKEAAAAEKPVRAAKVAKVAVESTTEEKAAPLSVRRTDAVRVVRALYASLKAHEQTAVLEKMPKFAATNDLATLRMAARACEKVGNQEGAKLARKAFGLLIACGAIAPF